MKTIESLREKHHTFTYKSFSYSSQGNDLTISFVFILHPNIIFNPQLIIKNAAKQAQAVDKQVLDNLIFHLGLIEILSYWKAACSPKIKIQAGALDKNQISWWSQLIEKGMGEFYYQNKIDFTKDNFVSITSSDNKFNAPKSMEVDGENHLTLIGGGKDSAVSLEILKKLKINQLGLMLNPTKASSLIAKKSDIKTVVVSRQIDKQLLGLNQTGYLNGHTPFSAYLAFLSLLIATLFKRRYIVVSNERSSEEENIVYLARKINHQYSKSLEFEKSFNQYSTKYISPALNYFSLSRPLWEIQISKIFTQFPAYLNIFKSCNQGQKTNQWCYQCPKCLSVFILLFPFLKQKTVKIFSKDLYQDTTLIPLLKKLSGLKQPKPFECVGTREEIIIGLYLSIRTYKDKLPKLLDFANKEIISKEKNLKQRTNKLLQSWGNDQFLNPKQKQILKELAYA